MASIKEISERYELSQDTLRYYERIGLLPTVHRGANGIRDYTTEDENWVEFIKCMRSAGLTIETLIEYVTMFQKGENTIAARKTLLIDQREILAKRIAEMKTTLDRLDNKIDGYETRMLKCESKLKKHS